MLIVWLCIIGVTFLLSSCSDRTRMQEEADFSSFGTFVYRLDTVSMEKNMTHILKSETSSWKADKAVLKRYEGITRFEKVPLWYNRMGVSDEADSLLAFLRMEVPLNGLDTTAFYVPQIAADLSVVRDLAFDSLHIDINELLPRLDYHLSKAYVRYVTGQRYGFMRPDKTFNNLEEKTDPEKKERPKGAQKEYQCLFGYEYEAPDYSKSIEFLESVDRWKYLLASFPQDPIYPMLREKMRIDSLHVGERLKLAANMERCRWRIKHPIGNDRKIIVNIPAQMLWALSPDSILAMRICCGATNHKTPLLWSEVKYMQVNPDWIVPRNIIKADFLRHAGDSSYFARNRYYIVDKTTGDTLNPADVLASEMKESYIRIGQKSGEGNSLGRIVFRFENDFGIYLHDTNNRKAFDRERRTLSHGCIRVQKPFELACFLLPEISEWQMECLRLSMDIEPITERGKKYLKEHCDDERPFRLIKYKDVSPRIPVYIVYYTAFPNPETGILEFWPDLYGYDKVINSRIPVSFNSL